MNTATSAARRPKRVSGRERGLALGSLACGLLLAVAIVAFVLHNLGWLALALAGLALAVGGLWWAITERMPRRGLGIVGGVGGVVLIALTVIWVTPHADRPLLRLVAMAVLLGGAVGFGRAALTRDLQERDDRRPVSRPSVLARPVLICNPWSGGGKVEKFGLVELAKDLGVEVIMLDRGLDLEQLARDAIAGGADCLGMAGGDGSQALVASIAIEHGLPFVCVSAGTRNHFALDLGIDREDPRLSLHAFGDGIERRIDYATVGRPTVRQQRVPRHLRHDRAAGGIPRSQVGDHQGDAARDAGPDAGALRPPVHRAPTASRWTAPSLIQVSNNPYVLGATLDASQRRRLDTGTLGIVAISAAIRGARRPRCSPSRHWVSAGGAATGTSSVRSNSRCGRGPARPMPASTVKRWSWRPRWSSGSIRADCGCWSPKATSPLPSDVGLGTFPSAT